MEFIDRSTVSLQISVGPKASRGLRSYALTLRPQFWLLSQRTDHRIWLDQTATEVLEKLLNEHGLPGPDLSGVVGVSSEAAL